MKKLNPSNTLAIIVDIQERLMPVLHESEHFVAKSAQMIQGLQALDIPMILTEQYPKGLGKTVDSIQSLLNENVPVFEKTQFSAMTDDVLAELKSKPIENIILIGCETHVCMLQTVLDLREHPWQVYVPQECITSRTLENKNNGLQQIREAGATISNIESLLFQLLGDAKHPVFKTISKLIQ